MNPIRRSIPEWAREVVEGVSLAQILLFCYVVVCLLYAKVQELLASIRAPIEECDVFFDSFAVLTLDDEDTMREVGRDSSPFLDKLELFSLLPNVVTKITLWDKLWTPPAISLLYWL